MLTIAPIFVIHQGGEPEPQVSTANDQLDQLVKDRFRQCGKYLQRLLQQQLGYVTLAMVDQEDYRLYLTIEKSNQQLFSHQDTMMIRQFFDKYNRDPDIQRLVILTAQEADDSPFFDDLGDLHLGFRVEQIDYI